MEWVLAICTQSWAMCGNYREFAYPNEKACYRAIEELYKHHDLKEFKYVVCSPIHNKTKP
jgi:hypothetical protein